MHHLGVVGYAHRGTDMPALAEAPTVTVITLQTGEVLSTHIIDPTTTYWRTHRKPPSRLT